MLSHFRELLRYRELLISWTLRDIKVRYKQSVLGIAWAILQPFSMMVIFTVIFSFFVKIPTDGVPYPIFAYTALLPWTFFANSLSFAVPSLVNNMNLVTKIYFPREIFPLAAIIASFVDFSVASVIFVGMMVFYRIPLSLSLLLVPLIVLIQIILMVGVSLFASALNVFYRDVRFVIPLGVQLWMYATPIIYPLSLVPERLRPFYMLNPMVGIIDSYRKVILSGQWPDFNSLALAAGISLASFLGAYWYFKNAEMEFADVI